MSRIDDLIAWSLVPRSEGVPVYKGMDSCPYCLITLDEAMVERTARKLREFLPGLGERATEIAGAVLREALDERTRNGA